jgi:hypothetical protein
MNTVIQFKTCRHPHLLNMRYCYHCGQEFENPWMWLYGPLWMWAVEMNDGYQS